MAVLTAALARLRADFDTAFPGRDTTSDGWIGDPAHQETTSGHNPDDTSGVSAEYSDSDSKQEVRAIDVDRDLGDTYASLQDVIDTILATPNDCKRLAYIIFDGRICSKNDSWHWEPYYGDNPHDKHAHFSGDPAYDEDNSQWSVASMGDYMTDGQAYTQHVMNYRLEAVISLRELIKIPDFTAPSGSFYPGFSEDNQLALYVHSILEDINSGTTTGDGLTADEIAAATVDKFATRLAE